MNDFDGVDFLGLALLIVVLLLWSIGCTTIGFLIANFLF